MVAVSLGLDTTPSSNGDGLVNTTADASHLVVNETWLYQHSSSNQSGITTWPSEFDNEDLWMNISAKRLEAAQEEPQVEPVGKEEEDESTCQKVLQLLLIVKTVLLAVALLLEISMAWLALRGTMWDVQPRRFMEYVLYTRLRTDSFPIYYSPFREAFPFESALAVFS